MTDELVFAIVLDMEAALGVLEQSIQILAAGDPALASDADITRGALGLQRQIDRLKGLHALVIAEADRRELWRDSGARNVADWVAGKTNTSVGDTKARAALGSAMRKSKKLEDAVRNGDVTAASAQNVANAVNNPPDGAGAAADRWTEIHRQESDAQAADTTTIVAYCPVPNAILLSYGLNPTESAMPPKATQSSSMEPSRGNSASSRWA